MLQFHRQVYASWPKRVLTPLSFHSLSYSLLSSGYSRDDINHHMRSIDLERKDSEKLLQEQSQRYPGEKKLKKAKGKWVKMIRSWNA